MFGNEPKIEEWAQICASFVTRCEVVPYIFLFSTNNRISGTQNPKFFLEVFFELGFHLIQTVKTFCFLKLISLVTWVMLKQNVGRVSTVSSKIKLSPSFFSYQYPKMPKSVFNSNHYPRSEETQTVKQPFFDYNIQL